MNKSPINSLFDIDIWYQQPLGSKIAEIEKQQLQFIPPLAKGKSLLQLGAPTQKHWLNIHNNYEHIIVYPHKILDRIPNPNIVQSCYTKLPFPADSFDTIILPHVLEFTATPKIIINEAWHTLAAEGYLIVLGFNSWSLNHLNTLFDKSAINLPTHTKFYSANKIYQWLKNFYYEIEYSRNFFYLPFACYTQSIVAESTLEKIATSLLPNCGGIYLMVIKKKVIPVTPLRPHWNWRELLANKDLIESAAGNVHRES